LKLQPDAAQNLNTVTRYGPGFIEINQVSHASSVLVMPEGPITPWLIQRFEDLRPTDFEQMIALQPQVIIFGSGARIRFPKPELLAPLFKAKIGIETMDLQAACRTYNILMAEGRQVLGAFLID
jgi:uncharacterized protein